MRVLLWSDSGRLFLQCNAGEDRARRVQQPHEARQIYPCLTAETRQAVGSVRPFSEECPVRGRELPLSES